MSTQAIRASLAELRAAWPQYPTPDQDPIVTPLAALYAVCDAVDATAIVPGTQDVVNALANALGVSQ